MFCRIIMSPSMRMRRWARGKFSVFVRERSEARGERNQCDWVDDGKHVVRKMPRRRRHTSCSRVMTRDLRKRARNHLFANGRDTAFLTRSSAAPARESFSQAFTRQDVDEES